MYRLRSILGLPRGFIGNPKAEPSTWDCIGLRDVLPPPGIRERNGEDSGQ